MSWFISAAVLPSLLPARADAGGSCTLRKQRKGQPITFWTEVENLAA